MKLSKVADYDLRMCMKEDKSSLKYFKGDNWTYLIFYFIAFNSQILHVSWTTILEINYYILSLRTMYVELVRFYM